VRNLSEGIKTLPGLPNKTNNFRKKYKGGVDFAGTLKGGDGGDELLWEGDG